MLPALESFSATIRAPTPWLLPHLSFAQKILQAVDARTVADALNTARSETSTVRFVDQVELTPNEPYEAFIARTSCVPTRDNLHDLFNGLMWLAYPVTKRRLNELQAQEIAARGITGSRGAVRDALTVFDENAALLAAPQALVDALRARDWRKLFIERRELWQSATLVVFGHALLEKLMRPRKDITAHVWVVDALDDQTIAASLNPERLAAKSFLPLPVLGIPGWSSANERPAFYDDPYVFRPANAVR
jgi:hypothetical protein